MRFRRSRLVDLASGRVGLPQDVLVSGARLYRGGPILRTAAEEMIDLEGRYVLPGLWDEHVHFDLWAAAKTRFDISDCISANQVLNRLAARLLQLPYAEPIIAFGARRERWSDKTNTQALDAVTGSHPVAILMKDLGNAWVNSAGLHQWGFSELAHGSVSSGFLDRQETAHLVERLDQVDRARRTTAIAHAQHAAAAKGIVGIVDLQAGRGRIDQWRSRAQSTKHCLQIRIACWPDTVGDWVATGLTSGMPLDQAGWLSAGPLKIVADGSVASHAAWCTHSHPLPLGAHENPDVANISITELSELMSLAERSGINVAVHAIGQAIVSQVLDCFSETGAHGSIEHATVVRSEDLVQMADLGLTAGVQPARGCADGQNRALPRSRDPEHLQALATMARAGIPLRFGSDAPTAPLDPWLAISLAVNGAADEANPQPSQTLSIAQALRSSTAGISQLVPGGQADLVVLEQNPLTMDPRKLADIRPYLTMSQGRITYWADAD